MKAADTNHAATLIQMVLDGIDDIDKEGSRIFSIALMGANEIAEKDIHAFNIFEVIQQLSESTASTDYLRKCLTELKKLL